MSFSFNKKARNGDDADVEKTTITHFKNTPLSLLHIHAERTKDLVRAGSNIRQPSHGEYGLR